MKISKDRVSLGVEHVQAEFWT